MRLEVMQRTMQAMADMDLDAAKKMMAISEKMAESFPRPIKSEEMDAAKLQPYQVEDLVETITGMRYAVSEMKMAPIAGAILQQANRPCFSRRDLN